MNLLTLVCKQLPGLAPIPILYITSFHCYVEGFCAVDWVSRLWSKMTLIGTLYLTTQLLCDSKLGS